MSYYDWYFEGETKKEYVRSSPFSEDELNDIIMRARSAVVSEITKRLEEELGSKGYRVTVIGAWPEIEIVSDKILIPGMTPVYFYTYRMKVRGKVRFETDRPLSESPLPAWLGPLLDTVLKWVVIAIGVSLAIYFLEKWIESMTLQTTVVEEYSDGQLVSRTVTTTPSPAGISGLIILLIVVFILAMLWRRKE